MFQSFVVYINEAFYPKSVAQLSREDELRYRSIGRQMQTELLSLQREIREIESKLRVQLREGREASMVSLTRTLDGLRKAEDRKQEDIANVHLLRYKTNEVSSMSTKQGMVAGLNRLVVKQNLNMNPNLLVAQQKRVSANLETLKNGTDALNATMQIATGDVGNDSAEAMHTELCQMETDRMFMTMPQVTRATAQLVKTDSAGEPTEATLRERIKQLTAQEDPK